MQYLKQSTAVDVMIGPFVDDTDGKTTEEALTLAQADLQLSKNCGTAAQKNDATSATHIYGGNYKVPLDITDTGTLGRLDLMCKKAGALPIMKSFMVVTANVYDTLCSTDQFDVNVTNVAGTAQTANDNGADINTLLTRIIGTLAAGTHNPQSADNNIILAHADYGLAQLVRSTTPANTLDVSATGEAGLDFDNIKDATGAHTLTNITVPVAGSVTGAVGSVTGDVGGNVTGTVTGKTPAEAGDAMALTAGAVDDIWDEDVDTSHQTAGTAGKKLDDAGGAADPWATAIPGAYGAGTAGKIVGDNVNAPIATVDTVVDAIKAKTDNLPADPASETNVDANETKLDTIAGYLDTEIAAILEDTGTTLPAQISGLNDITAADVKTAIEAAGSSIALIKAVTDALTTAAATKLALSAGTIVSAAAAAGTLSTTQMTTDLTEVTNDHYNGRIIIWTSGVLQNQATNVTDYDGATKMLTYTDTTEAPSDGDTFILV